MHAANSLQLGTEVEAFFINNEPILGNIFSLYSDSTNRIMYTDGSFGTVNMSDSISVLFTRGSVGRGPCEYTMPNAVYTVGQHFVVVELNQFRVLFFPLGVETPKECNEIPLNKDMPNNSLFIYDYDAKSNVAKAVSMDDKGGLYSIEFNSEEWKLIDSTSVFKGGNTSQVVFSSISSRYYVYNGRVIVYPSIYEGSLLEVGIGDGLLHRSNLHAGIKTPFVASKEPIENYHGRTASYYSGVTYFKYTARTSGMVRIDDLLILLYNDYRPNRCEQASCLFADVVDLNTMEYQGTDALGFDVGKNRGIWNFVPYGKKGNFVYYDSDDASLKVGNISMN